MSVRLKGLLSGTMQSRRELSYLRNSQVEQVTDFPCEMTFQASGMFLEHETEAHHYLPYLHFIGQVTELRGNFPYGVSSIYFGERDLPNLQQDVFYYPTPDELAHLIQHCGLYSDSFKPSDILKGNTYSLPVKVNLSIIPPENEDFYTRMTRSEDSVSMLAGMDKSNIPVFYTELLGSGVDRKNDRTLAYYGLDFESDFPLMVMTAEASGYTDPPLISQDYWPDAVCEKAEDVQADLSDYYITPEEEAELMRLQAEKEKPLKEFVPVTEPQFISAEEQLLANANRQIANRMYSRTQHLEDVKNEKRKEREDSIRKEQEVKDAENRRVREADSDYQASDYMVLDDESSRVLDLGQASVEDDGADGKKLSEPDVLEQQVEVKMDLNPDENAFVEAVREEASEEQDVLEADESEVMRLESADVSDAKAQAKVNEANALETALDVATDKAKEQHDERELRSDADVDEKPTVKTIITEKQEHREVPERVQKVAEAYDVLKSDNGMLELD